MPGDFFYNPDHRPKSPIAEQPSVFTSGSPLGDQPSVKAMAVYLFLSFIQTLTLLSALISDTFLTSNSGAEAGLTTLYNENGETVPLEGDWQLAGDSFLVSSVLAAIMTVASVVIMCCTMAEYNQRFVQASSILAILTALCLVGGCVAYELFSKDARYDPRYDTQSEAFKIERNWQWGSSFFAAAIAAIMSIVAAICAFAATPEAALCETEPCEALRHCLCCTAKNHQVEPFALPVLPSQGQGATRERRPQSPGMQT